MNDTTETLCKKCQLPLKESPNVTEWCACEVGVDIDENGEPLYECQDHGIYSGECGGCDQVERDIDEAIEREVA